MKPSDLIPTQDIDALVKLAHVARREGDRAAALAAFEAAAAANPTRVGLKAEVATELRALGRLDEAEALLRQVLAIDPLHVASLAELGHIARRRGDRAAALAAFEAAAAANPTHARTEGGRGWRRSCASLDVSMKRKRYCGRHCCYSRSMRLRWLSLGILRGAGVTEQGPW